ncbi:MAG: inorganic diphosphatase [Clostridia bacterium]|nr:inorganic diphosphatase [Clostridia bacterium]
MNIWHDMNPEFVKKDSFQVVIEITKGSKLKYELDKSTGLLRLDRILYTSTHYPANYGFIPLTYADDDDPLDVLVICSEKIMPMTIVDCYPIGVIKMIDGGRIDEKVIAIAKSDPYYNEYHCIYDLPAHVFDEMKHFFSVYKQLEFKDTAVEQLGHREEAEEVVEACIKSYRENREKLIERYSRG